MRSSRGVGLAVEETTSFPSPAQDYYEGPLSLDKELIRRPASTFIVRVGSEALRAMGIHPGDELVVDRSLDPAPGRVLVVVHEDEHRLGRFEIHSGRAWLVTDDEEIPLTADVVPWGVATVVIHHLPLGNSATSNVTENAGDPVAGSRGAARGGRPRGPRTSVTGR